MLRRLYLLAFVLLLGLGIPGAAAAQDTCDSSCFRSFAACTEACGVMDQSNVDSVTACNEGCHNESESCRMNCPPVDENSGVSDTR
jgi:hypothetical protein